MRVRCCGRRHRRTLPAGGAGWCQEDQSQRRYAKEAAAHSDPGVKQWWRWRSWRSLASEVVVAAIDIAIATARVVAVSGRIHSYPQPCGERASVPSLEVTAHRKKVQSAAEAILPASFPSSLLAQRLQTPGLHPQGSAWITILPSRLHNTLLFADKAGLRYGM